MKTEKFKRCAEKLVQEYERSKVKHPDFDSVDRAARAIQREHLEVCNELLRDTVKPDALAEEMLHLSNVALQGYMFLAEDEKENKTMIRECWFSGVLEAVQAIKDKRRIQINYSQDPDKWQDCDEMQDGSRLIFLLSCQYRAKPEPKFRALTPQEWLEKMSPANGILVILQKEKNTPGRIVDGLAIRNRQIQILFANGDCISSDLAMNDFIFSDGSPCGVEVVE